MQMWNDGPGVLMGRQEMWMQAVQTRLEQVRTKHDLSPVLGRAALVEARRLARTLTNDIGSLPAMHLLGWLHWYRYQALPSGRDQQDLRTAVAMFTGCMMSGMSDLPEPLLPLLTAQAIVDGTQLLELAQRSADQEILSATVVVWRRILAAAGHDDYAHRVVILSNLANALMTRFERTGAEADLDDAIQTGQQAIQATPGNYPERASILASPGTALLTRFRRTGAEADLDDAIYILRQAVEATTDDHPDRASILCNLGAALRSRFERTAAEADLDRTIQAFQQAMHVTPDNHPHRALILSNLGSALGARFGHTGALSDLDSVIQILQQAVHASSDKHLDRAGRLTSLGAWLLTRFQRTGAQADLDDAIQSLQEAAQATTDNHPDRAQFLSILGSSLRIRFEITRAEADLDNAIQILQQAVHVIPDNDPCRAEILSHLGNALRARFQRTGALADINRAIEAFQEVLQTAPDSADYLSDLGFALTVRFQRTGVQADLDSAIDALQQAVRLTADDHPASALHLNNLGKALTHRFQRTGAQADIDSALQALRQAVQVPLDGERDLRPWFLVNLGGALAVRFRRTGSLEDLDDAIQAIQQAVQSTPDKHPDRREPLSNLGTTMLLRFESTGIDADLDSAIQALQQAVQCTPDDHPDRAGCLTNLGAAMLTRFESTEAEADLDNAIQILQQAVHAIPGNHPDRVLTLSNLGNALRIRFGTRGDAEDSAAAFQMYSNATDVEAASASARIYAARSGASLVARTDPGNASRLLRAAVLLLPEVAPRFLERGDQQHAIGRFAGLAADAAALALSDPTVPEPQRPAEALRLLEAARGVLLSQALSTRGDLSVLSEQHSELAVRFAELRDWLDAPSAAGPDLGSLPGDDTVDAVQRAIRHRRLAAAELTQLLARIRSLEGFATFGLPPSVRHLEEQARWGPLVVLNISAYRSDAILLTSGSINSLRLPGLDPDTVFSQVRAFHQAIDAIAVSESPLARVGAQQTIRQVLAWLWDRAAGPVLHALGYRDQPPAGEAWPELWWVSGGPLALLPIHAAGHHTSPRDPGNRTVMDRIISSHTPTVAALAHARASRPAAPGTAFRSLIVAMPTTPDLPGEGELLSVSDEAAMLHACLPDPVLLSEVEIPAANTATGRRLPTKAAVLDLLPASAIAHFACHGYSDPADPSQSHLLLHDHRTDPLTVAALAPLTLNSVQLAYLSACTTARVSDSRLLDEAIHLSSAFQLAGFPHVISTLWEINDAVAVEISSAFYAALANSDGTLDTNRAARALHQATRTQRDRRPANPYLWASHIHVGA